MIKVKQGEEKVKRYKLTIPLRKKVIKDYFNSPGFNDDINFMKKAVLEEMSREDFFRPSPRKIEALKRKKLREEKEKRRKEQEKLDKLKKEENKKIEEDLKSGKDVSISNRLKFWFRTNVEDKLKTNLGDVEEKVRANLSSVQESIKTNLNGLLDSKK